MLKEEWKKDRRRYFQIAGITIQVDSDLPITDGTFDSKFDAFEVDGEGEDTIIIQHHSPIPDVSDWDLGKEVYRSPPWAIYRKEDSWIYVGILPEALGDYVWKVAIFNYDHTRSKIYNPVGVFPESGLHTLATLPSDQILLARILADREGCYLHSVVLRIVD